VRYVEFRAFCVIFMSVRKGVHRAGGTGDAQGQRRLISAT
jgi:hypothetical protein